MRTTWPTMLNPMTYAGMVRLGGIVAGSSPADGFPFRPL